MSNHSFNTQFNIGEKVYHKVTEEIGIVKYIVLVTSSYFEYGIVWESAITSNHAEIELMDEEEKKMEDLLKGN
jgi:hypothetical protein